MTVSEFVDIEQMTCNACGEPLKKPETAPALQKTKPSIKKTLSLANKEPETKPDESTEPTKWQISQKALKDSRPKEETHSSHLMWSSLIFFILGGVMLYLRYCGGYLSTKSSIDMIRVYGPIAFIIIHIIIIIKAFKDTVFQGVLCMIIPFYSIYYLFAVSDDFYMRAIVGGLMVGIGQDTAMVFNEEIQRTIKSISDWIASGG